jgi:hypothetical protein
VAEIKAIISRISFTASSSQLAETPDRARSLGSYNTPLERAVPPAQWDRFTGAHAFFVTAVSGAIYMSGGDCHRLSAYT